MSTNHALRSAIGKLIRRHRKNKDLSIKDLSTLVGVSASSVTTIEVSASLSIDMLYRYAEAMECEAKDLLPTVQQLCETTVAVQISGKEYEVTQEVADQIAALLKGDSE